MINIKKEQGLGTVAPGEDHYSGMLFYGTAPVGWASNNFSVRQIGNLKAAEDLGIVATGATAVWHYHISEFFRVQPNTILSVGIFNPPVTGVYDFQEIRVIQLESGGRLRQAAVYLNIPFDVAHIAALEAVYNQLFEEDKSPLAILYTADFMDLYSDRVDLPTLPDLRQLTAANVSVVFGQDGNGRGQQLFDSLDVTISCIGATLGTISRAAVNENISWIDRFNVVTGNELDVPALGNGTLAKRLTLAEQNLLTAKGYIFLRKEIGIGGTYHNDSATCVAITNDFNRIERNRTIDKAVRGVRASLLPQQGRPVRIDPTTGKLDPEVIAYFQSLANESIKAMQSAGEISGTSVFIDPEQNFLQQGNLEVQIRIVPIGVVFNFNVSIGFTNQL